MKSTIRLALLVAILVSIGANRAGAYSFNLGEVDSAGSFTFPVFCLTAAGLDTTADSISIRIYKRTDGDSVKTDDQTDLTPVIGTLTSTARTTANHPRYHLKLTTHACIFFAQAATPDSMFTGTYSGVVYMTVGTNVTTATSFTFSPVDRANGHGMQGTIVQYWAPYNDRTPAATAEDDFALKATIAASDFTAGAIDAAAIAADAIGASEIATDAIGAAEIAANALTTAEINTGAISADEIADDAIDAGAIAANALTTAEIATGAISSDEVADNAIDAGAIATDAIGAAEIAASAIDFGVELDTGGLGASGWAHGTRTLTALDEDATTIDLNGSIVGPWDATTMDSVLQALDYTTNTHEVVRQVVSTVAAVTSVASVTSANVSGFDPAVITDAAFATDAIKADAIAGSAIGSSELASTAAAEIKDTILNTKMKDYRGDVSPDTTIGYIIAALGDSIMHAILDANKANFKATGFSTFDPSVTGVTLDNDSLAALFTAIAGISAGSTDTVAVWRLFRRAFGLDVASGDTLTVAQRTVTAVGVTASLPDSIAAFIARMGNYFYNDSEWAATGSACGDGPQTDSIFVVDTSGADTGVPGIWIGVTDNAGNQWHTVTNGSGWAVLSLAYSTIYAQAAFSAGYIFKAEVDTTGSDGSEVDTIFGYNVSIGQPSAVNLKRLYDYVYTFTGDSIQGADVIVELLTPDSTIIPYDTSSGVSLGKNPVIYTTQTNASGYYQIDLIPNNYIRPANTRYRVTVTARRRTVYSVVINAVGTTTATVRSLQ